LLILIQIALALAALYSGGMYLWVYVDALKRQMTREEFEFVELNTFHLGLSFILAAGFLALTLGGR